MIGLWNSGGTNNQITPNTPGLLPAAYGTYSNPGLNNVPFNGMFGNIQGQAPQQQAPAAGKDNSSAMSAMMAANSQSNPLQQPLQNLTNVSTDVANAYSGMLGSASNAMGQMFDSKPTDIEKQMLKQASQQSWNHLAGAYGDIPGHSAMGKEFGDAMAQATTAMANQRQNQVMQGMGQVSSGLIGAAQTPYNAATGAVQTGSQVAMAPLQALLGAFNGMPYSPPVYQSGGGGGK